MAERALVLGGGGPVGIAWECGVLAGLAMAGVDLAAADFILGTSAGSFVGAQIAGGRDPIKLAQAQIDLGRAAAEKPTGAARPAPAPSAAAFQKLYAMMPNDAEPSPALRREFGALSKSATVSEAAFLASFGPGLAAERPFPAHYGCTAVNCDTGEFKVWRAADGVPLARAVASSCSVPGIYPPIALPGGLWMDGGVRSGTSLDAAASHRRVLTLAVVTPLGAGIIEPQLAREEAVVRAAGGAPKTVRPDAAALSVFGVNLMDAKNRAAICEAGIAQGRAIASEIGDWWA